MTSFIIKNFAKNHNRYLSTTCSAFDKAKVFLNCPKSNKGLSFNEKERDKHGLTGLLPVAFRDQSLQVKAVINNLRGIKSGLLKYRFLRQLQDNNERLFYSVLCQHTEELLPIVYTPVVGEACQKFSYIFERPRGLYISLNDVGKVAKILDNWHEKDIRAICVTDGGRILGLGDLGANGMGIPIGKLCLYTALAGVPPHITLPVLLDVGTNNEYFLDEPLYIGLRRKRATGDEYDRLLDEFMEAVKNKYGDTCLVQFEDFNNENAFRLLKRYQDKYCVFNDDIQGTASVCVAGLLAACKITNKKIYENTFLFFGAGSAAKGIADLLLVALQKEGLSEEEALSRIWLMDAFGLLTENRPEGEIESHKQKYVKKAKWSKNLEEIVDMIKPTALIGAAAQTGAFTEKILNMMAELNERPIIFSLSNPTSKAECTAKEAYMFTDGRAIFASGSPFDPLVFNAKAFHPSQGNNAYIFPGVGLAIIACGVRHIPDETFYIAAKALADLVTEKYLSKERLYPPLDTIQSTSLSIAVKVSEYFYRNNLATVLPEPVDKLEFLKQQQYNWEYD